MRFTCMESPRAVPSIQPQFGTLPLVPVVLSMQAPSARCRAAAPSSLLIVTSSPRVFMLPCAGGRLLSNSLPITHNKWRVSSGINRQAGEGVAIVTEGFR